MSHIFQISSISNEKPSISFEASSISIKNLGILGISNQKFQNTGFSHLKFEIIGISSETTKTFLDQQQKHSTLFINSFPNPTGESSEVIYK